jgi:hypothetical protein
MSKKSEASLNDVTVLALNHTVLLMCMRTRHTMRNSQFGKESIEVAIFTPPIRLNINDLMLEKTLNV